MTSSTKFKFHQNATKINHSSLLHRYLSIATGIHLINGNQYIQRSLLIFLTFSNFIDGRFNMRYTIQQHWPSLDKNKKKEEEGDDVAHDFSSAQTKSHHTTMATLLAFTSSFPSSWEHGHQKALQKG